MSKRKFNLDNFMDEASLKNLYKPALKRFDELGLSGDEALQTVLDSSDFDFREKEYLRHIIIKRKIESERRQGQTWPDVYASVSKQEGSTEALLDAVESEYQVKVANAGQLQQLTGIEEHEQLHAIFMLGREQKYCRALHNALSEGAMYQDLLQIKSSAFGLPDSWMGAEGKGADQRTSIIWAIGQTFQATFLSKAAVSPDLRSIANNVNAPYSVVIDAFEEFHARHITLYPNQSA